MFFAYWREDEDRYEMKVSKGAAFEVIDDGDEPPKVVVLINSPRGLSAPADTRIGR